MQLTETGQIVVGILALIAVYTLTRKVNTWRIKRAYQRIIKDLQQKGALSPSSAVSLPYGKVKILRVGMRDFRPHALQFLVSSNIVGMTGENKYYIKDETVLEHKNSRE
jgi:hypothetical protein